MNTIKPICLSAIAVVLAGCETQKQVTSYTAMTAIGTIEH
jgi:hypothetical protein